MQEVVKTFLEETKQKKIEQLLGIALDTKYWEFVIGDRNADDLRKKLSEEQQKLIKSDKGVVLKDERNMDTINELNVLIDAVEKAEKELDRLKDMDRNIRAYLKFVTNPDTETKKRMDEIAQM